MLVVPLAVLERVDVKVPTPSPQADVEQTWTSYTGQASDLGSPALNRRAGCKPLLRPGLQRFADEPGASHCGSHVQRVHFVKRHRPVF